MQKIKTEVLTQIQNQTPQNNGIPDNLVNAFNNPNSILFISVQSIMATTSKITVEVILNNQTFDYLYVTPNINANMVLNLYRNWQTALTQFTFLQNLLYRTLLTDSRIIIGLFLVLLSAGFFTVSERRSNQYLLIHHKF